MWLPLWITPQYIIDENHIVNIFINNRTLLKICKGSYGLPQSGRLDYIELIKHIQLHGYTRAGFPPNLFKHVTRDTMFSLVVDDFGMKSTAKNEALRLIDTLKKKYPSINIDWSGKIFLIIHLEWDYNKRTVSLSMTNYVKKSLSIFQHKTDKNNQHSPHTHTTSNYGANIQYAPSSTTSNITESQIIYYQQVIVTFLFYTRVIDYNMLTSVGYIDTHLSTSQWDNNKNHINNFLDYESTHP